MTEAEPPAIINEDDPLPSGIADENFAARLREERERKHWLQSHVAKLMRDHGWPWHPQTVQKIETGRRKVTAGEAVALAGIFETTVERLALPGKAASAAMILTMYTARAGRARQQVGEWANVLLFSQTHLERNLAQLEKDGYLGSPELRRFAAEAREAMRLSPEAAVAEARRAEEEARREEEAEEAELDPPLRAEGSG